MSPTEKDVDVDALLKPIAGDNPAGADLRYSPVFDKIKQARRSADDKSSGKLEKEETGPGPEEDWLTVARLASDALARQSKDLQLAVWLLEVRSHLDGFEGVAPCLQVVRELMTRYWDCVYPMRDDEEDEPLAFRVGVMEWIDEKLPQIVKAIPLTDPPAAYSLLHYEVTQKIGAEKQALLETGWPSGEDFEAAMANSSLEALEATLGDVVACQEQLRLLTEDADRLYVVTRKTASGAERTETLLSFGRTADALENCRWLLQRAVTKKRPVADAPPQETASTPDLVEDAPIVDAPAEPAVAAAPRAARQAVDAPVDGREQALARLAAGIDFLLADNPADPTPYLLSRAIAFGPLLAHDDLSEAWPFPSPPTELRQRLRALAANGDWPALLQECERYLRATPNQPWIDLQRYVVTALTEIGGSSLAAASAVEAQVRALVAAHPHVGDAEFEDGTPTANGESKQWLRERGPAFDLAATVTPMRPAAPVLVDSHDAADTATPRRRDEALALARAGRTSDALALLQEEITAATSGRERFLCKLDMAEICLESERTALAYPLLDELAETIERARLEEWEDKDLVARAWTALVTCCRLLESNPEAQARGQEIFRRLCRLDVSKALSIDKDPSSTASRWSRR